MPLNLDPMTRLLNNTQRPVAPAGDKQGLKQDNGLGATQRPASDIVTFSGKASTAASAQKAQEERDARPTFGQRDASSPKGRINYKHPMYRLDMAGFDPDKKYRFWDKSPETQVFKALKEKESLFSSLEKASMYPIDQKHPLVRMIVTLAAKQTDVPNAHLALTESFANNLGRWLVTPRDWEDARNMVDYHIPALMQQAARQADPQQGWEKTHRLLMDRVTYKPSENLSAFAHFLLESADQSVLFQSLVNLSMSPDQQGPAEAFDQWYRNPAQLNNIQAETLGVIAQDWPKGLIPQAGNYHEQVELTQLAFLLMTLPVNISTLARPLNTLKNNLEPGNFRQTREALLNGLSGMYAQHRDLIPAEWVNNFRSQLLESGEHNRAQWITLMEANRDNTSIPQSRRAKLGEFLAQGLTHNLPVSGNEAFTHLANMPANDNDWNTIAETLLATVQGGKPLTLSELYTQYLDRGKQRDKTWEGEIETGMIRSEERPLLAPALLKKHFKGQVKNAAGKRVEALQTYLSGRIQAGLGLQWNGTRTPLQDRYPGEDYGDLLTSSQALEEEGVTQAYQLLLSLPVPEKTWKQLLQAHETRPLAQLLVEAASSPEATPDSPWLNDLRQTLSRGSQPQAGWANLLHVAQKSDRTERKQAFTETLHALIRQELPLSQQTWAGLQTFLELPIPERDWEALNRELRENPANADQTLQATLTRVSANKDYDLDSNTLDNLADYLRLAGDPRHAVIRMKREALNPPSGVSTERAQAFRAFLNREFDTYTNFSNVLEKDRYQLLLTLPVADQDWKELIDSADQGQNAYIPDLIFSSLGKLDLKDGKLSEWLKEASRTLVQDKRSYAFNLVEKTVNQPFEISDKRKQAFVAYVDAFINTQLKGEAAWPPESVFQMHQLRNLPVSDTVWEGLLEQAKKAGGPDEKLILSALDKLDMSRNDASEWLEGFVTGRKADGNKNWPYLDVIRQTYESDNTLSDVRRQGLRELLTNMVLEGKTSALDPAQVQGLFRESGRKELSGLLSQLTLFAKLPVSDAVWTELNKELKRSVQQDTTVNLEPLLLKVAGSDNTPADPAWFEEMQRYLGEDPGAAYLQLKKEVAETDVPEARKQAFNQLLNRLFEKRSLYRPDEQLAERFNLLLRMPVSEEKWNELIDKLKTRASEDSALFSMPNMVLLAVSALPDTQEGRDWLQEFEAFTRDNEGPSPVYRPFLQMKTDLQQADPQIRDTRGPLYSQLLSEIIRNQYMPDATTAERYKLLLEMPVSNRQWQETMKSALQNIKNGQPVSSVEMLTDVLNNASPSTFATPQALKWLEDLALLLGRLGMSEEAGQASLIRLMASGNDEISDTRKTGIQGLLNAARLDRSARLSGEALQLLSLFAQMPVPEPYWSLLHSELADQSPANLGRKLNELLGQVMSDPDMPLTPEWEESYRGVLSQGGQTDLLRQLSVRQEVMKSLKNVPGERTATLQKLTGKLIGSGQTLPSEAKALLELLAQWPATANQWQDLCASLMGTLDGQSGDAATATLQRYLAQNALTSLSPDALTPAWLERLATALEKQVGSGKAAQVNKDTATSLRLLAKGVQKNAFAQHPQRLAGFMQLLQTLQANYRLEGPAGETLLSYAQLPVSEQNWQAATQALMEKSKAKGPLGMADRMLRELYLNLPEGLPPTEWLRTLGQQLKAAGQENGETNLQLRGLQAVATLQPPLSAERRTSLSKLESLLPNSEGDTARKLAFLSIPVSDATWNRLLEMVRQVDSANRPKLMDEMLLATVALGGRQSAWMGFADTLLKSEASSQDRLSLMGQVKRAIELGNEQMLQKVLDTYRDTRFIRYFLELAGDLSPSIQSSEGYQILQGALGSEEAFTQAASRGNLSTLMPMIQERALSQRLSGQDKNQAELMELLWRAVQPAHQKALLKALATMSDNPAKLAQTFERESETLAPLLAKVGNVALNARAYGRPSINRTADGLVVRTGAYIATSVPGMGTVVIRNSQPGSQSRQALPQVAYYSSSTLDEQSLASLNPATDSRFEPLLSAGVYDRHLFSSKLAFLLRQIP